MKLRLGALLLGALLFAAAPVGAQTTTRTYVATASATALTLTVGGEGLHLGQTSAALRSDTDQEAVCEGDALTCATGAGEPNFNLASAHSPGDEGPNDETGGALPEELSPVLNLVVADARAEASATGAQGDAGIVHLDVNLVRTILEQAEPVTEALQEVSDSLLGAIAEGDPSGVLGPRLKATVDHLIDHVDSTPLVTLDVLPAQSRVVDDGNRVMAQGVAKGLVLAISPTELHNALAPEGLIIVEVGAAEVRAFSDGTVESDPAAVRIKIFDPLTGEYDVVPVAAGEFTCVAEDTPVEVCVGVGATATADGAAGAGGVSIQALADPLPQLVLEVGRADVAANEAVDEAPGPPPPPVEPPPAPLPTTGGGLALPALGLLGVGSLGVAALRRRLF